MRLVAILVSATVWLAAILALPIQSSTEELHQGYRIGLQRRTNRPPERKLSMYEYYKRTLRVRDQIIQAFERDPALKANVERILGVNDVSESSSLGRQDLMILTCLMEIARAVESN